MYIQSQNFYWINPPRQYELGETELSFKTEALTDFWQNTYYHFRHDNGHMYLTKSANDYFAFSLKLSLDGSLRFDQCGLIVYQNSEHWAKFGIECENANYSNLGGVVTNNAYSDWSMSPIASTIKELYLRLNRRASDFQIEYSYKGFDYQPLRIFHLAGADAEIQFGLYACSPGHSSFTARFSELQLGEGTWSAHT